MKTLMGSKLVLSIFSSLTALALAAGLAFVPAATAFADGGTPPTKEGKDGKYLEKMLQGERERLSKQQAYLDKAGEFATKAQGRIDELKAKGKDTSALEAALAAFKQGIAAAQAAHDRARSILDAHAGFDRDGHVTDRDQAKQTLKDARQALKDAQEALRQAEMGLRKALKDYRETYKGNK